jgi:hypothetical protein
MGPDEKGIVVHQGMSAIAFDEDVDDDGKPDNLIASGTMERPLAWLKCRGSHWVLRINQNGDGHESDRSKPSPVIA